MYSNAIAYANAEKKYELINRRYYKNNSLTISILKELKCYDNYYCLFCAFSFKKINEYLLSEATWPVALSLWGAAIIRVRDVSSQNALVGW